MVMEVFYLIVALICLVGGVILQIASFTHLKDDKLPSTQLYWKIKSNYKNSKGYRYLTVWQYMFTSGLVLGLIKSLIW